ncbi:MAG: hypothetical protein R6U04_03930, partial [Bacteroidales bacterium]
LSLRQVTILLFAFYPWSSVASASSVFYVGTRITRIELMTADYFNCLVVELFSCLEDDGSYYS